MKKLLSILAAVGLTATASTSVVACSSTKKNQSGGDSDIAHLTAKPVKNSAGAITGYSFTQSITVSSDDILFDIEPDPHSTKMSIFEDDQIDFIDNSYDQHPYMPDDDIGGDGMYVTMAISNDDAAKFPTQKDDKGNITYVTTTQTVDVTFTIDASQIKAFKSAFDYSFSINYNWDSTSDEKKLAVVSLAAPVDPTNGLPVPATALELTKKVSLSKESTSYRRAITLKISDPTVFAEEAHLPVTSVSIMVDGNSLPIMDISAEKDTLTVTPFGGFHKFTVGDVLTVTPSGFKNDNPITITLTSVIDS